MLDFIVCDDNVKVVNDVADVINKFMISNNMSYKIYKFLEYDEKFMKLLNDLSSYRIYILDIETPLNSGIDIARKIRRKDKNSVIIFLTGHDELGFTVLKSCLNFLTFISKFDNYKEKLEGAIAEALDSLPCKRVVSFVERGIKYHLPINSILYITRDTIERKTIVKTDSNEYKLYISLDKFNELANNNLTRTHKSCFVNMYRVEKVDGNHNLITFDNASTIDLLSNKYKKEVIKNG